MAESFVLSQDFSEHSVDPAREEEICTELSTHREAIDEIDTQLVGLFNERAKHSLQIRALKRQLGKPLFDAAREEEILAALVEYNDGPLYDDNIRAIFETILKVMKEAPCDADNN